MMNSLFTDLINYAKDNHMMLRLLVYLSSEEDVEIVLEHVPVHVVAVHIFSTFQQYRTLNKEKVC